MKKYIFFNLLYIFNLFFRYHSFNFKSDHFLKKKGEKILGGWGSCPFCPPPLYATEHVRIEFWWLPMQGSYATWIVRESHGIWYKFLKFSENLLVLESHGIWSTLAWKVMGISNTSYNFYILINKFCFLKKTTI